MRSHLFASCFALALFSLLSSVSATSHGGSSDGHLAKRQSSAGQYGLTGQGTQMSNGISVGLHLDWNAGDRPDALIQRLGKVPSVIGGYVHLNLTNQTYWEMDDQLPFIIPLAGTTVYTVAVLPSFTLDQWTPNMTATLASQMARVNALGLTVWLRWAYEMNGDWMAFGHDPTNYVRVWQEIYTAVKAAAPQTYMMWCPNVKAANPDNLDGYDQYYPGAEYVSIAGLDIYWLGSDQLSNQLPSSNLFATYFKTFYDKYSPAHDIVLGETASPYHYLVPPQYSTLPQDAEIPGGGDAVNMSSLTVAPGGDGTTEDALKEAFFGQLASDSTKALFPKLFALVWFEFVKIGGPRGTPRLNDFRIVKQGNDSLTTYFRGLIGNETAYQLGVNPAPTSASSVAASPSATGAGAIASNAGASSANSAAASGPSSRPGSSGSKLAVQGGVGLAGLVLGAVLLL